MKNKLHRGALRLGGSLCLLMLALTAAVATPVARADKPTFIPLQAADYVDTTCGFPVSVHFVLNGEVLRVKSNGDILITGPLSAEYSANGKTVSRNISGPAMITTNPDGSVTFRGQGVSGGVLQTASGLTLAVFAGPISVSPTTGFPTLVHGTILVNLCDALAPS
jgi:hypothetical protein